jgi:hypothetical protein
MKTMKNFLSMAALALMGAMMTGCSSDDNFDNPQQIENKSNVVTLTTTVGFDASAGTRALTIDGANGVKTFEVNDQIAVVYKKKTGGATAVAVSEKLTSTDIASGSKSATFTVTLDDPDKTKQVTYIYPAAMAGSTDVDYTKLNSQDGTLASLQTKYDLCTKSGAWASDNLPSLALENQLAILAINLKNSTDITSTITGMTIKVGSTLTYTVSRSAAAGPIYVAIQPVTSQNIEVTATDGTNGYVKTLTSKTYDANNGYNVTWNMTWKTITWNSTNVFNDSHQMDKLDKWNTTPLTYEGITISFSGNDVSSFNPYSTAREYPALECHGDDGDSFTFTAPSGKKFTKIEIISNLSVTFTAYGDWTQPAYTKIVWSGTPANEVTLGGSNNTFANDLNSIVFTLEDE